MECNADTWTESTFPYAECWKPYFAELIWSEVCRSLGGEMHTNPYSNRNRVTIAPKDKIEYLNKYVTVEPQFSATDTDRAKVIATVPFYTYFGPNTDYTGTAMGYEEMETVEFEIDIDFPKIFAFERVNTAPMNTESRVNDNRNNIRFFVGSAVCIVSAVVTVINSPSIHKTILQNAESIYQGLHAIVTGS